jgi:hypothetical protein
MRFAKRDRAVHMSKGLKSALAEFAASIISPNDAVRFIDSVSSEFTAHRELLVMDPWSKSAVHSSHISYGSHQYNFSPLAHHLCTQAAQWRWTRPR